MQDMLEPEDLFNPRNYDSVRRRFDAGRDPAGLVLHLEEISTRRRTRPDLLQVLELHRPPEPRARGRQLHHLQLLRRAAESWCAGEDRQIRAFINSCPHRGSEIMEGEGTCRVMKCPYHAWAFELNGEPYGDAAVPGNRPRSRWPITALRPIKLDLWAGLHVDQPRSRCAGPQELPRRSARGAPSHGRPTTWSASRAAPIRSAPTGSSTSRISADGYHVPFVHQHTLNFKKVVEARLPTIPASIFGKLT